MRKYAGGVRLAPVVGLMAAVGVAGNAQAAGFQLKEQSAEGLGNAFAGSAAKAKDLSTMFFNPAGLANLSGHQGQVELSYIAPTAEFTDTGSGLDYSALSALTVPTAAGPVQPLAGLAALNGAAIPGQPGQDDAIDNALVPALYAMYDYSEDLKFGFAINTPFGLVTDYDDEWIGRYHALKSDLRTFSFQPTVAWQATDWLSIGGGPVFQYAKAELSTAVDTGALLGAPGRMDTKATVEGDSVAAGVALGVMLEPLETTRIGLSWRSGMTHDLEGDVKYTDRPDFTPLGALAPAINARFADSEARAELNLPDIVSLGVYHEFSDSLAVMGEVSWTNWSVFRNLTVYREGGQLVSSTPENWEDSFFYALGATWKPMDKLSVQLGVAYDQSPVTDEFRTPRVPDADRTWLATGIGYEVMPGVTANLSYTHIFVDDARVDLGSGDGLVPAHTLRGTYESDIDIVSAQVRVTF